MRQYSHFLSTLYDEQGPVGKLGRGTHYSILRTVLWDKQAPEWHDFAVVWDADHDLRIVPIIARLYSQQLLRDVLAIGERKGGVTIITASARPNSRLLVLAEDGWQSDDGDFFNSNVEHVDEATGLLINDDPVKVQAYVKGIASLWGLGTKPFTSA